MSSHLITLGVGTPSDVPHFVLLGLSPSAAPTAPVLLSEDASMFVMSPRNTVRILWPRDTIAVRAPRATTAGVTIP